MKFLAMTTCELLATIEFDGVSKTLTHQRMHFKCKFRVIYALSLTDSVNLGTDCENLRTFCVRFVVNVEVDSKV